MLEIYTKNNRNIKEPKQLKSHISQLEVAVFRINNLEVRENIDSLMINAYKSKFVTDKTGSHKARTAVSFFLIYYTPGRPYYFKISSLVFVSCPVDMSVAGSAFMRGVFPLMRVTEPRQPDG
ncbi:hypothetical protein ACSPZC_003833 [Escherichia coli]|nr:hypothetical protein [Escherichia coli]